MKYHLTRSKRKTIAISFDRDGNLCVKAPYFVSTRTIELFLKEKEAWINATSKRLENQRKQELLTRRPLENGDVFSLLGDKLTLTVIREERQRGKVVSAPGRIILHVPFSADYEMKRELIEKWYRKEAAEIIRQKAEEFAKLLKVSYEDIRIKDQKSRWGSCSSKGNLNFNYRIIMAPETVCDYVVIHELCHLVHMDHSPAFWSLVESVCPTYRQYVKWLKTNGKQLNIS